MKCEGEYYYDGKVYPCQAECGCGLPGCLVMANGMRDLMRDVSAFHRAVDAPVLDKPTVPSDERVKLRGSLIQEEYLETMRSMFVEEVVDGVPTLDMRKVRPAVDMVALADGLADLIYVAVGCALEFGIPLDRVWAEVQRSNLDKVKDGVIRRFDGKILKPASWKAPDIEGCLK